MLCLLPAEGGLQWERLETVDLTDLVGEWRAGVRVACFVCACAHASNAGWSATN